MMDFFKKWWRRRNTPYAPPAASGWDATPVAALLICLREEAALRPNLGLSEAKTLLRAFQQGLGLEDRQSLEALLTRLLVKNEADRAALAEALDDFLETRTRLWRQITDAARRELEQKTLADIPTPPVGPEEPLVETPAPPRPTPPPAPASAPKPVYETTLQLELSLSATGAAALAGLPELAEPPADAGTLPPQGHRFIFTDDYQPISRRQMDQIWRFLRKPSRTGGHTDDIDFPRTVERLARQGWLDQPEWQRGKFNKVHLVLLLDHGGSMLAWHTLARQLATSARGGGGHRDAEIFWFYNLPHQFESAQKPGLLFRDPAHLRPEKLDKLLQRCSKQNTEILIFSDAGAARGRQNRERFNQTGQWLRLLKRHVSSVAWLNPAPAHRWWGSSAEWISHEVGMFEANPRGLMEAVNHLRGR